ncbi:site-specific DNA-methyltransferase [Bacillus sp. FJAT-27245]|uniref:site-specific DNA-methyltransferase n=1 Tax=Bacillus sp. FJAT-27245 TaxID=1684144 RepID=UPI0006A788F7|nr:site-specific DNA-methyltransferase [Bacillus sp. FJAT-27245]
MPTLQFKGKSFVQNHHFGVKYHQLIPHQIKSYTEKVSLHDNLIVHGDNLKALKALLPTYAGKVKCIYIDPPYNTGNEKWAYNDNVNSPMMKDWLGEVVDKDDLSRHDKWLCMMMPRLKLLRELLREDGAIFVSIDDNEQSNLKLLMDEVFGERNFIACVANVNNPKGRSDDKFIATAHEYLLIYKKDKDPIFHGWEPGENVLRRYRKEDEQGLYREIDLRKTGDEDRRENRPDMFYYFYFNEETEDFYVSKEQEEKEGYIEIVPIRADGSEGRWRWGFETAKVKLDTLIPKFMPNRKIWGIFEKDYLTDDERIRPTSAWTKKDFNSERGTEQFVGLGFEKEGFFKPKPVGLLKHIIDFATREDDIILDSFAGSGTTAQAVLELNKEDGGNRQFILVELENYADEVTAERVRRRIQGVKDSDIEDYQTGTGGTFSYFTLGEPIEMEAILHGENLPLYEDLARYVFFTSTGEEFDPGNIDQERNFIGESSEYEVYLFYRPDIEYLKSTSLNLETAKQLGDPNGKKRLVFAPMKYLDQEYLHAYQIEFSQLPFEIYRMKD